MLEPDRITRREIREIRPKIEEAIRREDFEAFLQIIISKLGVERGSERCRLLESKFWNAVAERRRNRMQRP